MAEKKDNIQKEKTEEVTESISEPEKTSESDTPDVEKGNSSKEEAKETEKDQPHEEAIGANNESSGIRWLAALAYLPLICLIPLFLNRDDEFIQKHAKQGFILFLIEIAAMLMTRNEIWILIIVICFAATIVGALGIIIRGEVRIPVLSDLADRLNI